MLLAPADSNGFRYLAQQSDVMRFTVRLLTPFVAHDATLCDQAVAVQAQEVFAELLLGRSERILDQVLALARP